MISIFWLQLVGYTIAPNGVAYSGGPSITGAIAPGHHMEITVLQLYKVSLSAGKAHRDHKHHHVHHFDHEGLISTTAQPTPPPEVLFCIHISTVSIILWTADFNNSFSVFVFFNFTAGNNTESIFGKWTSFRSPKFECSTGTTASILWRSTNTVC